MNTSEMDEGRWVDKRKQYLSTNKVGYREKVAEAVAWSNLGYSASGIAKRMDVSDSTAKKYLDRAREVFPGILTQSVIDLDWDPEAPVGEIPDVPPSQCPVCTTDGSLMTPEGADSVHRISKWGATSMIEDAKYVCEFCHAVFIDGVWDHAETVNSRAYHLSDVSDTKGTSHYREKLTAGIDVSKQKQATSDAGVDDAEGW